MVSQVEFEIFDNKVTHMIEKVQYRVPLVENTNKALVVIVRTFILNICNTSGRSVSVYIDTRALHENFLSNDLKRSCFQTAFKA